MREGSQAKDFELAIQWLLDCGLIHKVNRVSKPALPLKAYLNLDAFKIYLLDIGLLIAMTDLDARVLSTETGYLQNLMELNRTVRAPAVDL